MLTIEGLRIAYGEIEAVSDFSMTVPDHSVVALLGRNGAGKTTTLKGIMGLIASRSGAISYNGKRLNKMSPSQIASLGISYVPEGRGIFTSLTVRDNLAAAAYGAGMRRREANAEIERRMAIFPILATRSSQRAGTLSGGEQQMLAIARALVGRPTLLLLDEPGLGLAPIIIQELYRHFITFNSEEELSILLVEQYVDLALRTASSVFVLEKGRLAYQSAATDLTSEHSRVAEFIS